MHNFTNHLKKVFEGQIFTESVITALSTAQHEQIDQFQVNYLISLYCIVLLISYAFCCFYFL